MFLGRSGAGKTTAGTLARLAGAELISEEIAYVALEPRGARLCSLPFREKNQAGGSRTRCVPVAVLLRSGAGRPGLP